MRSLNAMIDFNGKAAIVTGGGSGIGAVIATMLAEAGARVAIAGRKAGSLDSTAAAVEAATGMRPLTIPTDVRDAAQAERLVETAVAEFGSLDLLVNNAGKGWHAALDTMPVEAWDRDIALNLSAAYYGSRAAVGHLERSGSGAIVNISSVAGVNGSKGVGAYSAAKAGLQMFTRVAAAEWGPRGVRVNAVAPGMIATAEAVKSWKKTGFDASAASASFPLARPGQPEDIAYAVLFLASGAAAYITGETLVVNGGPNLKGMIDP